MNTDDIIAARLANQQLISMRLSGSSELVEWFGAVQSQDYPGATWALSLRSHTSDTDIEALYNRGEILRTHVLRPTWHFVSPKDIYWMLELTGAKVKRMMATYNTALGLSPELFAKTEAILAKELANNNYLTRSEIGELFNKHGITWKGNGLAHLVASIELNGVICSGPRKGKHHSYALLSERVDTLQKISHEQAIQKLTKLYFQSHGPAQLIDFNWWSGLSMKEVREGIEMNPALRSEEVDGKMYYFFETDYSAPDSTIYLLPNYDEYTVAYKDREALMKGVDKSKLDFRQNSLFNNVVIIDGKVEGVWRRTFTTKQVTVELRLFKSLQKREENALQEALERYGNFLHLPVTAQFL